MKENIMPVHIFRFIFILLNLLIGLHLSDIWSIYGLQISAVSFLIPIYVLLLGLAIALLGYRQGLWLCIEAFICFIACLLFYLTDISIVILLLLTLGLGIISLIAINQYWVQIFVKLTGSFYFKNTIWYVYSVVTFIVLLNIIMLYKFNINTATIREIAINSLIINIAITCLLLYPYNCILRIISTNSDNNNQPNNTRGNILNNVVKNSKKTKKTS